MENAIGIQSPCVQPLPTLLLCVPPDTLQIECIHISILWVGWQMSSWLREIADKMVRDLEPGARPGLCIQHAL